MPPSAIVATPGAANANSYATLAEGDTYWGDRQNGSAWTGATPEAQAQALIQATDRIDQEQFVGTPVNPLTGTSTGTTQALKWPRYAAESPDGWDYLQTVIPEPVKEATLELARAILDGDFTVEDTGLEGFDELVLGPLELKPRHAQKGDQLPVTVRRKLRHVLMSPSEANVRVWRS